jgi:hypothetical protein
MLGFQPLERFTELSLLRVPQILLNTNSFFDTPQRRFHSIRMLMVAPDNDADVLVTPHLNDAPAKGWNDAEW